MEEETHELTLEDFARLFGEEIDDIPENTRQLIAETDFTYKKPNKEKQYQNILNILKTIESGKLSVAGKEKIDRWEEGWGEILENFSQDACNFDKLVPQYMKPAKFVRLYQDYVMPKDPMFELRWFDVFRNWFFQKYLKSIDNVYEFGCGTGYNLVEIAKIFPEKKLYGSDWAKPSADIIKLLAKKHGYNMQGHVFDIFSPDENMSFFDNSAAITIDALEQIGPNFEEFLKFLLKKAPALCINIEPIYELYDVNNLADYLAMKFHKKRNYLSGFLTRLLGLEKEGKIEIIKTQRVPFGCLYQDAHSYIIWRVKK